MHKQNDVVVYMENGIKTNALVLESSVRPDIHPGQTADEKTPAVEHLNLIVISANTQGVQNITPVAHGFFVRPLFGVRPLTDEKSTGWYDYCDACGGRCMRLSDGKDAGTILEGSMIAQTALTDQVKTLSDENAKLKEEVAKQPGALTPAGREWERFQIEASQKAHVERVEKQSSTVNPSDAQLNDATSAILFGCPGILPSSADLDAVAAEQKTIEATATEILEHGTDEQAHAQAAAAEAVPEVPDCGSQGSPDPEGGEFGTGSGPVPIPSQQT